jgi:tyrosine-protein kinase Etk/Wzc
VASQVQVASVDSTFSSSNSILVWFRVGVRWRRLVLWTVTAIIVLSAITAWLLPVRYTATVVILPPQQGGSAGAAMMAQLSAVGSIASAAGGLGIKNPNDQQVALLKSRIVEDALVARFQLQKLYHRRYLSTARAHWEKATKAESGLKDGLIRLSVTDRDPGRAAEMANAWVEEYKRFSATLAVTEASQRRLFYERQVSVAREDLAHAEEEMKQTEQRTGVIDLEGQGRSMIASAAVLRGQLAAKQIEIKAMREFAADGNPDLQRAQEETAGMEAQLASMDAANDRATGDLIVPKGTVTQSTLDYERALREVKYRETIQDLLMRQYEGARVDEAKEGALVQVVEPAVPPDRPDSNFRLWIVLGMGVFSFPIALMVAAAAECIAIVRRFHGQWGSWTAAFEHVLEAL